MSNLQVAQTIKSQIGMMTLMACGARDFVGSEDTLYFRVLTNRTLNKIVIKLNAMDLYDIEHVQISKKTFETKVLESKEGIYAEDLSEVVYHLVNK